MNANYAICYRFLLWLLLSTMFATAWAWNPVSTGDGSTAFARHESGTVVYQSKIYLLGGRSTNNLQVYDPTANSWTDLGPLPTEMHHFQPVLLNDDIYVIGSFACCFPEEVTNPEIFRYNITQGQWSQEGSMPADRLRGSTGTVVYNGKIYILGGNTRGHNGGAVPWFDEYDPATGSWSVLPDAPNARDHFVAVIANDKLVAAAGRRSLRSAGNTVSATDIYDFGTGEWSGGADIPTPRGGTMAVSHGQDVIVLGGESLGQVESHRTVEVYNLQSGSWSAVIDMITPRHSGGAAILGDSLHAISGNLVRGGGAETNLHEVIALNDIATNNPPPVEPDPTLDSDNDGLTDVDERTIHFTDPEKFDTDGDGLDDKTELIDLETNPLQRDTDLDGVEDEQEINLGLNPLNADSDNDGLIDGDEISIFGTNALSRDSDGDSLSDGDEVNRHNSDPKDTDTDNDNIPDGYEVQTLGSNPANVDTDNDGLQDALEIHTHRTDPNNPDSDRDGLTDSVELSTYQTDPLVADSDGDSIPDGEEISNGTNPTNTDEDGDGLLNIAEGLLDTDGDSVPNYKDRDSDNDGIPDLVENGFSDVDRDGIIDTLEEIELANERVLETQQVETETNIDEPPPARVFRETRSVLLSDDNAGETSATALTAPTPISVALDSDNDGVPNYLDLDSDQDGISDLVESSSDFTTNQLVRTVDNDSNLDGLDDSYNASGANHPVDTDSDGIPNFLDLDSDNDGVFDVVEAGSDDADQDGKLDSVIDTNNNGIADLGIPLLGEALPDVDKDNIPDLIDVQIETGGRFGCSIATATTSATLDPTLLAILLLLVFQLMRRNRQYTIRK